MNNDPFFKSYPSRQTRPVPAYRNSSPKVVSVPVHFFSSARTQLSLLAPKDSATLKIQRVFRGFLVRKSLKNISSIRNEVCEVENRINDTYIVDLIRRDEKERLRVNETPICLLFKLDSIRGVDFGVRDFRKAVIRKAIVLQETVDSFVAAKIESEIVDGAINTEVEAMNEIVANCNPVDEYQNS